MTKKTRDDQRIIFDLAPLFVGRELYILLLTAADAFGHNCATGEVALEKAGRPPFVFNKMKADIDANIALFDLMIGWMQHVRQAAEKFVRGMYLTDVGYTCSFHLSLCPRCDAPSWQQPCPFCDFYPMGDRDYNALTPEVKGNYFVPFERFEARIKGHVNFTAMYYASKKNVVAYSSDENYKAMVQHLIAYGLDVTTPTPHEIWAAIKFYKSIVPGSPVTEHDLEIVLPNTT